MTDTPIIRLELEQMKHTLLVALGKHNQELSAKAEAQITKAIEDFNWQQETTVIVHDAIRNALQSYFGYGEGYNFISEAINKAFTGMFKAVKK